jgi:hypothetical protein
VIVYSRPVIVLQGPHNYGIQKMWKIEGHNLSTQISRRSRQIHQWKCDPAKESSKSPYSILLPLLLSIFIHHLFSIKMPLVLSSSFAFCTRLLDYGLWRASNSTGFGHGVLILKLRNNFFFKIQNSNFCVQNYCSGLDY